MMGKKKTRTKIVLVSYPKIVFLYPTFVVSLVAAICLSLAGRRWIPPAPRRL